MGALIDAKDAKPVKEVATRTTSADFWNMIDLYLPNPDIVLGKAGETITALRDLLTDARVWAGAQNRKAGTMALEWELDRGRAKSRAAKAVQDMLDRLDMNEVFSGILDAVLFGYQPLELLWAKDRTLLGIEPKPPEWFVFDGENRLRFLSKNENTNGELVDRRRIICATSNASYQNPYGEAVLSRCYWPVIFKKGGLKFWLQFTERHGMPWVHGTQPRGRTDAEAQAFAAQLATMLQNGVVVTPDDESVNFIAADARASSDLYKAMIDHVNSEISSALLGHAGAGESVPGKLGAEEAAVTVRRDIVDADKRIVETTINQVIKIWMEVNAISGEPPRFIMYEQEDVDLDLAQRDEKLSAVMATSNLRLSREYFRREYGLSDSDMDDVAAQPEPVQTDTNQDKSTQTEFAEPGKSSPYPDQDAIDDAAAIDPARMQELAAPMVADAVRIFRQAGDYPEAMSALAEAYPEMKTDEITELLARAMFVADIWGRISAQQEAA